jgi:hypothetical protein
MVCQMWAYLIRNIFHIQNDLQELKREAIGSKANDKRSRP